MSVSLDEQITIHHQPPAIEGQITEFDSIMFGM